MLSISFEVDVPTMKVGGSLLFERRNFLGGSGGMPPPQKILKFRCLEMLFRADAILAHAKAWDLVL